MTELHCAAQVTWAAAAGVSWHSAVCARISPNGINHAARCRAATRQGVEHSPSAHPAHRGGAAPSGVSSDRGHPSWYKPPRPRLAWSRHRGTAAYAPQPELWPRRTALPTT